MVAIPPSVEAWVDGISELIARAKDARLETDRARSLDGSKSGPASGEKEMSRRIVSYLLFAGLLVMSLAPSAMAQEKFPKGPITLISVFAAGGPSDTYIRFLANKAKETLGVPVVVENKLGGAGTVGPATMAATAKPDGYTISFFGVGMYTVPLMQKVSFDPAKDFTYIIGLSGYRIIVAVKSDSRFKTWEDVVAEAKANPKKLTFSTPGYGSATHLAFESAAHPLGLKLNHVPFKGASEQVAAMLGGHVDVTAVGGSVFPVVDGGQARALLWLTDEPGPKYPNIRGLNAIGIKSEIDLNSPFGLAGPKGMDPAVVKIIHDAFKKAMDTPEHEELLKTLDQPNRYMSSADFTAFAHRQIAAYKVALERLGMVKKD
jgi:tripartite-type tricarboxylate transporter receptor subunit TctC